MTSTVPKVSNVKENESEFVQVTIEKTDDGNVEKTHEDFDNCSLKKKRRFNCYWRAIGALHDMGHAITRLPCFGEADNCIEKKKREEEKEVVTTVSK